MSPVTLTTTTSGGAVRFDDVSKRYRLGTLSSLRDTIAERLRPRAGEQDRILWAVRNLSFDVAPGEALALIGPNGAGKTTTLKLLAKVTRPTTGSIRVSGRLSSLIELGAGFHPELTGRENVFLNGAILGLKRNEIASRFDDIIAFSEIGRFVDTPVKRYSSGMYVRLAFAVAAHVEPDVLLVDEVLAVGDASFRHRCIDRMQSLQRDGTTILFVSHNMHLVRSMCSRAILLQKGQLFAEGPTDEVILDYEKLILGLTPAMQEGGEAPEPEAALSDSVLLKVIVESETPGETGFFRSDESAIVRVSYRTQVPQSIGRIDVRVMREDGTLCTAIDNTEAAGNDRRFSQIGTSGEFTIRFCPLQYTNGRYYVLVRITDPSDAFVVASARSDVFGVLSGDGPKPAGVFVPAAEWGLRDTEASETLAGHVDPGVPAAKLGSTGS